jgi:excisionase family DNA binding protein
VIEMGENVTTLSVKQVAERLGVSESVIYRLAQEQKLPCFRVGGSWRFREVVIHEWIESQEQKTEKSQTSQQTET